MTTRKRERSTLYILRHKFTLIELLIVIAIIAILASILLPALNQARSKAIEIKCLSNMKQTGRYAMMYASEHRDFLFPADCQIVKYGNTSVGQYMWSWHAATYFKLDRPKPIRPGARTDFPFSCADPRTTEGIDPNSSFEGFGLRVCAVRPRSSLRFGKDIRLINTSETKTMVVQAIWRIPSTMILFGDSAKISNVKNGNNVFRQSFALDDYAISNGSNGIFAERHNGRGSICYGDGHAGTLRGAELKDEQKAASAYGRSWSTKDGIWQGRW